MKLIFNKFHGAGNDFVLIDNRDAHYILNKAQIAFICDRHFGVGADGLMVLGASNQYDFEMKYYNSDGQEGSMCGNGGRCIVAYAELLGIKKDEYIFEAIDGLHRANILEKRNQIWNVTLQMSDVNHADVNDDFCFLDTGSPHHIKFVDDVEKIDVYKEGKFIRNNSIYGPKGGTNVNFVSVENEIIKVRTYERGVEDETLACGTGVTAVAMATAIMNDDTKGSYKLRARGGDLQVQFNRDGNHFTNVWLTGPAAFVFSGEIDL